MFHSENALTLLNVRQSKDSRRTVGYMVLASSEKFHSHQQFLEEVSTLVWRPGIHPFLSFHPTHEKFNSSQALFPTYYWNFFNSDGSVAGVMYCVSNL